MVMHRVNYHLSEVQHAQLRKKAKALGLTVAELIRRAVDAWLEAEKAKK